MDSRPTPVSFYEDFWADTEYALEYATDAARRERFPAIQNVWGGLPRPRRILDFGCGNGALSDCMLAHEFGESCVGIDVSRTAIADARRHFDRPGLSFESTTSDASLHSLGRFDVVVSSHVLEHLDDPDEALLQLLPLAPRFVLEVPLERCLVQDGVAALRRKRRSDNRVGHRQFWSRRSFRDFLEHQGLEVIRDFLYASAPFCPYASPAKRTMERLALGVLGTRGYARLMTTHYCVLAEPRGRQGSSPCAE